MKEPSSQPQESTSLAPRAVPAVATLGGIAADPFGGPGPERARPAGAAVPITRLLRYRWTILLVTVAVIGPGCALIVYTHKPMYRANGEISVDPVIRRLVYNTPENGAIPLYQQFLNSQAAIVRSSTILNRVLALPAVQATNWHQQQQTSLMGEPLSNLERLQGGLEAKQRGSTQVIDVTFACADSREAALIVNAVLDQYRIYTDESKREEQDAVLNPIQEQFKTLNETIEGLERTEAQLRGSLEVGSPETVFQQRSAELVQLETRRDELARQIKLTELQVQDLDAARAEKPASESASQPAAAAVMVRYQFDPEWRRLSQDLLEAQNTVEEKRGFGLSDSHPRMATLLKTLASKRDLLKIREEQLDQQPAVGVGAVAHGGDPARPDPLAYLDPRTRLTQLQREASTIEQDIQKKREALKYTGGYVRLLQQGEEELKHKKKMLNDINEMKLQREFERNAPGSIRIQTLAFPPSVPSNSNRRLMFLTLACVGGLAAGLAVAYLRAMFTRVIADGHEAVAEAHSPFLGLIPWMASHEGGVEKDAWQHESIRVIRTLLLQRLKRGPGAAAVAVTSAGPSVGKTMLAVSLARSLASTGKRVLLVDADFRRPALASRMGLTPSLGLIRALRGGHSVDDAMMHMTETLDVIPAGAPMEHRTDSELLADGRLSPLIERWRRTYDIIVFDTSPVLAAADAAILARQTDGTVFVMREGRCLRPDVTEAVSILRESGGNMIGTVVLGSQSRRRMGYQYYYGDTIDVDSRPALDARQAEVHG